MNFMKNIQAFESFFFPSPDENLPDPIDSKYIPIGEYDRDQAARFFIDIRRIENREGIKFKWDCLDNHAIWNSYMGGGSGRSNIMYLAKGPNGYLSVVASPDGRVIGAADQNNRRLNPQEEKEFMEFVESLTNY